MSFRNQPQPTANEILRGYNVQKNEFVQHLQSVSDLLEVNYPDGSTYLGQLSQDRLRHGKGIYTYPEGDVYFGTWNRDEFHGRGIYLYSNQEIYDGEVQNGLMEGKGIYYYEKCTAYYCGNWHRGLKHGDGLYFSPE